MIAAAIIAVDGDMGIYGLGHIKAGYNRSEVNILTVIIFNQNFTLEVVEDTDGNWTTKVIDTVFTSHQDPYASECKLN